MTFEVIPGKSPEAILELIQQRSRQVIKLLHYSTLRNDSSGYSPTAVYNYVSTHRMP